MNPISATWLSGVGQTCQKTQRGVKEKTKENAIARYSNRVIFYLDRANVPVFSGRREGAVAEAPELASDHTTTGRLETTPPPSM